jgi:hypothetical protein
VGSFGYLYLRYVMNGPLILFSFTNGVNSAATTLFMFLSGTLP